MPETCHAHKKTPLRRQIGFAEDRGVRNGVLAPTRVEVFPHLNPVQSLMPRRSGSASSDEASALLNIVHLLSATQDRLSTPTVNPPLLYFDVFAELQHFRDCQGGGPRVLFAGHRPTPNARVHDDAIRSF